MNKFWISAIAVVFAVGALFFWHHRQFNQKRCDYIESLAADPKVVAALDHWASQHVINQNYYFVSGMHGDIAAHTNGDENIDYLPLPDSSATGIDNRLFRFSISKHKSKHNEEIVNGNVHSLVFGLGRDKIIVTKNGHQLESHRGHDLESGKLKKLSESVFAYCSSGRFSM